MTTQKRLDEIYVSRFRRKLVFIANDLAELTKSSQKRRVIPLMVHDIIKDSTKQIIRAYKKLPEP